MGDFFRVCASAGINDPLIALRASLSVDNAAISRVSFVVFLGSPSGYRGLHCAVVKGYARCLISCI